ncbi:hypothetical protein DMP11_04840 [Parvibacter caecicola]|nr:hypothetical protein DMP11_04840 [Parvibacter caecicola]
MRILETKLCRLLKPVRLEAHCLTANSFILKHFTQCIADTVFEKTIYVAITLRLINMALIRTIVTHAIPSDRIVPIDVDFHTGRSNVVIVVTMICPNVFEWNREMVVILLFQRPQIGAIPIERSIHPHRC